MDRRGWAIVLLAAGLLFGFLSWEWYLSPEARVRRTIEAAAEAAEATDAERFLSFFTGDYADFLHEDRAALEARVADAFGRVDRINVTVQAVEVEPGDGEARARFDLVVVAVREHERYVVVGTPFEPEKIQASLVRTPEGWRIRRVERSLAAPPGL